MTINSTLGVSANFTTLLLNENFKKIDIDIRRKQVNFALLKLNSNKFNEEALVNYLKNASIFYALPPKRIQEIKDAGLYANLYDEAKSKFRKSNVNDGEGGELISYCINEHILKAPKILSKLKLKTNNNDYIKGADGIHLLRIDEKNYEIIYAESKMYKSIEDAIDESFKSIDRFIEGDSLEFEITTLSTNLCGEFEDIDVDYLKDCVLPSKNGVRQNTAFSIFIGFQIENVIDESLPYDEYEREIVVYVEEEINKNQQKLFKKLNERKRYSFYVYLIPFMNIEKIRKQIIKEIRGE